MADYEQLAGSFYRRIDCIAGAVDLLAPGISAAAEKVVAAVLDDRRLLICAADRDSSLAQYAALLLRRPGDDLPALPALFVGSAGQPAEQLWQDLRSLSRDGDLLLCIDCSETATTAAAAAALGQRRNAGVVLLSAGSAPGDHGAVHIELRAADGELRRELALMAFHELRGQILRLLMGE
jgi:DnaA initiator-associating protein